MRFVESVEVGAHGEEPVEAQLPGRQQHRHGSCSRRPPPCGEREDGSGFPAEGRQAPSSGTAGTGTALPGWEAAPLRPQLPGGQASRARPHRLQRPRVQGLSTAHGWRTLGTQPGPDPGCSRRPGTEGRGGEAPLLPYLRKAVPPGEEGAAAAASGGPTGGFTPQARGRPRARPLPAAPATPPHGRPRAPSRPAPYGLWPPRGGTEGAGAGRSCRLCTPGAER